MNDCLRRDDKLFRINRNQKLATFSGTEFVFFLAICLNDENRIRTVVNQHRKPKFKFSMLMHNHSLAHSI